MAIVRVNSKAYSVVLYDAIGKVVFNENDIVKNEYSLDLTNVKKGAYTVKVRSASGESLGTKVLIINK